MITFRECGPTRQLVSVPAGDRLKCRLRSPASRGEGNETNGDKTPILQRRRFRTLALLAALTLLLSVSGGLVSAQEPAQPDLSGTNPENNYAFCEVDPNYDYLVLCEIKPVANQFSLNLTTDVLPLAQQVNAGVTADTVMWIQAWGGKGDRGGDYLAASGGEGGDPGYAQTVTTINDFHSGFGTATIYYYLGIPGADTTHGGAATIISTVASPSTLSDVVLIAGGGGGGGPAPDGVDDGYDGGHGGSAIASSSASTYGPGQDATAGHGTSYPGGSSQGAGQGGCIQPTTDPASCGGDGVGGLGGGLTGWLNGNPDVGNNGAGGAASTDTGAGYGGGGYGGGIGGIQYVVNPLPTYSTSGGAGGGSYAAGSTQFDAVAPPTYWEGFPQDFTTAIQITFNLQPVLMAYETPVVDPFGIVSEGVAHSAPTFVDIDDDGDQDLFFGIQSGGIYYTENTGTATSPVFGDAILNPFGIQPADLGYSSPAFADIDADSDQDLFFGDQSGGIWYMENTGTPESPIFAAGISNPFGITQADPKGFATPVFVDLGDNGILDLLFGDASGGIWYFENVGSATSPQFSSNPLPNPFGIQQIEGYASPDFVDIEGDGDYDLVVGDEDGNLWLQYNLGGSTNPSFNPAWENPDGLVKMSNGYTSPAFVDITDDGNPDLLLGNQSGKFWYYENLGVSTTEAGLGEPTTGLPVLGYDASPELDLTLAGASGDQLVVTVHGADAFDASQVNRDIIALEDWFGNRLGRVTQSFWSSAVGDTNGDGHLDRTLTFVLDDAEATLAARTQFCVSGVTYDGVSLRSCKYLDQQQISENHG